MGAPLMLATASASVRLPLLSMVGIRANVPLVGPASKRKHLQAQRCFTSTFQPRNQPSDQPKKAVQAKDRNGLPGQKHPDGSYLLFHPIYSEHELDSVKVVHREDKTFGDKVARAMCVVARTIFDLATRYPDHNGVKFPPLKKDVEKRVELPSHISQQIEKFKDTSQGQAKDSAVKGERPETVADLRKLSENEPMTLEEMRAKGLCFGPDGWLNRIIFLETIAGVPGMVAATCRHLQSLRLMRRDQGWIHTMLEDAENERMHLLTFMVLAKPGWIARTFALLAQGVFYNFFFVFYLFAPRVAHRFVGVLEEEAVMTYSSILDDLKEGRLPEWENVPAPEIAKQYWQLGDEAMLVDVIRAVRADEATHRHINHTFASLEATDPNPFSYREPPAKMRAETYGLERKEALQWAKGKDLEQGQDAKSAAEKTA